MSKLRTYGTIGTPRVLQVSGIGDPTALTPPGIDVGVNLSTVGRNLQEKSTNVINHAVQPSFNLDGRGPPNCIAFPSIRRRFEVSDGGNSGTDSNRKTWIWEDFRPVSHLIRTTAIMRSDLGGAVDANLRVCDTLNLHVVDASVLPNEISAHMQSSLYGVAEKAPDIIKSGV
ncbi:hypothetical protein ACEPAH_38 [Sanghuangporus vaninii]